MSYQIFLVKFEYGHETGIPFDHFEKILQPYGRLMKHQNEWCFISDVGEICDSATLLGDIENGFYGMSFDRPTTHKKLPKIIFDLLLLENTCFFGVDMEFLQSRTAMADHLPEVFQENFPDGPQMLQDPFSLWPLRQDFSW